MPSQQNVSSNASTSALEAYGSIFNQLHSIELQARVQEFSHKMTLIKQCQKAAKLIIFRTVHLKLAVVNGPWKKFFNIQSYGV